MQAAVPKGEGGMLAVLGSEINEINEILKLNSKIFECYIANDNSVGQVVISGKIRDLEKFSNLAKDWWNPKGNFKPLHLFNPARIKFIRQKLISYYKKNENSEKPLKNLKILEKKNRF